MCATDTIRKRARAITRHVGTALFIRAQGGFCPICDQEIAKDAAVSVDHVYPINGNERYVDADPNPGNLLVVHASCNTAKGNRAPTMSEIMYLEMVNDLLGFDAVTGIYAVSEYAKGYVRQRIQSLQARRNAIDLFQGHHDRGSITTSMVAFGSLTVEIESLEVMIKRYDEVLEIHDRVA